MESVLCMPANKPRIKPVAWVTGGSQGIGRSIADALACAGYTVIISARTKKDVETAAAEISSGGSICEGIVLDVTDSSTVQSAVQFILSKHQRIDLLVCCAGIYGPIGPLEGNDAAQWQQALSINVAGTMLCVRAALPVMKKQKKGCILTIAGGGVGGPRIKPNFSSYVSSKFAICGFTEALSAELAGSGVRINAISPGAVNTRLLQQVLASGDKAGKDFLSASLKQKETGGTPPKLAAELVLYLASDAGAHLSGKVLSAVWDPPNKLEQRKGRGAGQISSSLYTLRRIDEELFGEMKKK